MCIRVTTCCGCCPVEKGSKFIAIFQMVGYLALAVTALVLNEFRNFLPMTLVTAINIVIATVLLIGVINKRPGCVLFFVIITSLRMFVAFTTGSYFLLFHTSYYHFNFPLVYGCVSMAILVLETVYFVVTYSYLNELFEFKAREKIEAEGSQFRFQRTEDNPDAAAAVVVISKDLPPDYDKVVMTNDLQQA